MVKDLFILDHNSQYLQKAKESKGKTANRGGKASTSAANDGIITDMKAHLRTVKPPKHSTTPLSKQIKVMSCNRLGVLSWKTQQSRHYAERLIIQTKCAHNPYLEALYLPYKSKT